MKATIVSLTQPRVQGVETAEDLIVYTARVSNPSNQMNTKTAPRLLRYLLKHGHVSPFEQVSMGVEVETSRAIGRQILRHWSINVQEFSQRYATVGVFETPYLIGRSQHPTNRQLSVDGLSGQSSVRFDELQDKVLKATIDAYSEALALGVCKEQARMLLPELTPTRMYLTATVRDWIFYFKQRLHESTQKEHRDLAAAIFDIFKTEFPNVAEAMNDTE